MLSCLLTAGLKGCITCMYLFQHMNKLRHCGLRSLATAKETVTASSDKFGTLIVALLAVLNCSALKYSTQQALNL